MQFLRSSFRSRIVKALAVTFAVLGIMLPSATPALAETSDLRSALDIATSIGNTTVLRDDEELIAGCAGQIYNGSGELECLMPFGCYWASIQAATGYNNGNTSMVDCYIKFPNGDIQGLGYIPASNGATQQIDFFFCPYGTYKFIYLADCSDTLDVAGFIYG